MSKKIYIKQKNLLDDKSKIEELVRFENRIANFQISFDISSLALLIYFSGGIANPFIFFFIFHMIISSIILSRFAAYSQASFAIFLVGIITTLEYYNIIIPNYIVKFIPESSFEKNIYYFGIFFVFTITLYMSVYMATSIVKKLRSKEDESMLAKDSLEMRSKELKKVNKKLREGDKVKSEYIMKTTHELRSPLAAIKNCLKVVTSGYVERESEKGKELLQRAEDKADGLLFIINDLLSLSSLKAEITTNPPEVLLMKNIIDKVVTLFTPQLNEKNISIQYSVPESLYPIIGDKENSEILLINLISNAVKYTPDGGSINIKAENKNGNIRIIISDTGIGIPEDDMPRIFEDFFRTKEAKNIDKRGTGLGMSIVKQIVKQHNGEINVYSKAGKGTMFDIV
ncbi:HAMP domain-containing histidine kinase, partial [bacterium]|nr:HAMP domain-containing histidine kinase [bacterium]